MALTKRQKLARRLRSNKKLPRILIACGILILAVIGTILLRLSFANTTTSSTANCGKQVTPYNYEVPFGNAVWNQPVCNLPRFAQSADYANRFFEWGNINDGSAAADIRNGRISTDPGFPKTPTPGDPDGLGTLYTTEIYYASTATTEKKVSSILYPSNLDGEKWNSNEALPKPGYLSQHPDTPMPWNPAWKTARGSDNHMIILDDRPGKEGTIYSLWGYNVGGCISDAIFFPNRVCGMAIRIGRGYDGNVIDYRTHEGYTKDRGVGLSPFATLTTADEVAAGEIRHALGVSIPNPAFGPECTSTQLQQPVNWNVVGKQCGTAVAPASKFEWKQTFTTPFMNEPFKSIYTQDKSIPEGMRFALDITYDQIEDWIDSRADFANDKRRADTARVFARALKDYGMMVVDTNAGRFSVQTEGGINPASATKWNNLAMGPTYKDDLLDGLITASNVYVVDPPDLTCLDKPSPSKFYCDWTDAQYQVTGDATKPTATLTNPAANATVSGIVTVSGTATDNVAVSKVDVLINNSVVYSVNANSAFSYSWDTRSRTNGTYTITVNAYDVAGNVGTTTRTVTVSNTQPPPVKTADFNKDGQVSLTDLSILLTNYNKTVAIGTNGDASGDGKVALTDLSILLTQYGK